MTSRHTWTSIAWNARLAAIAIGLCICPAMLIADEGDILPGTAPLKAEGDVAAQLVAGVDRFLLRKLDESIGARETYWKRDLSSAAAYRKSIEPNRKRLAHILGVRDARPTFEALELVATTSQAALVGKGSGFDVFAVRWPALDDVYGEGLLLVPNDIDSPTADVIALSDCDQTPEMIVGLSDGVAVESQYARRLAEAGCRVLIPALIDRTLERRAPPGQPGRANLTSREFIYRSAFELGRHLIGYELQKTFAAIDLFERESKTQDRPIGVMGWGEGGMLALYAAALDERIDVACVGGYFGRRERIWEEPLDRNVFSLLQQFGDAELATMVWPRILLIENSVGPSLDLPSDGGAPATLRNPEGVKSEWQRAMDLMKNAQPAHNGAVVGGDNGLVAMGAGAADFVTALAQVRADSVRFDDEGVVRAGKLPDTTERQRRAIKQLDRFNQHLLAESPFVRAEFMKNLDFSSIEAYQKSVEWYRRYYRDEVIGRFADEPLPFNARSRKAYDTEKWTGYEVVLDLFPDVVAYGVLLLPKDIKAGEKRPVVVCQHGLEGRPQDIITGDHAAYHDFAAKLAERGFITFAPQNLYIGRDDFRTLQRKANPLGKTLFSIIVPQHQQIVDWLKTHPNVDSERIAFYGLSYGGKTAMRVPPLVTDYCLSICSADFNEWVLKNASTRHSFSYVWTGEYEIFEFDLGSTFNYAEMAALICPRPFMVERGHFDGVGWDEFVAFEFAKVRHLYQAKLGIGDRAEIEWFVGPHTIYGQGTYEFLHKHLDWPKR